MSEKVTKKKTVIKSLKGVEMDDRNRVEDPGGGRKRGKNKRRHEGEEEREE